MIFVKVTITTSGGGLNKLLGKMQNYSRRSDYKADAYLRDLGRDMKASLVRRSPINTGEFAAGWEYSTTSVNGLHSLNIFNKSHRETRIPMVILLEYGHITRNGGYVPGYRTVRNTMVEYDLRIKKMGAEIIK